MTKTEYQKYLCGSHWKQRREEAIENAGFECEKCSLPRWLAEIAYDQDLHVHHESYANLGNELAEDLKALCRRCHELETFGKSELKAIKPSKCSICPLPNWNNRSSLCLTCESILGISGEFLGILGQKNPIDGEPIWKSVLGDIVKRLRRENDPISLVLDHLSEIKI